MITRDETPSYFVDTRSGNKIMTSMHYHSSYELYYLISGNRDYFVEDKSFSVSAGSFVLIPPSTLHRTGGKYGLRTLIGFRKNFLAENFNEQIIPELVKCFDNYIITPPEEKRDYFQNLLKKIEKSSNKTEFALNLSILLYELSKYKSDTRCDERISKITSYINDNYHQITSIGQIAEQFFISKYHLCRIFKDTLHITLIDYLNEVKIKNARYYIESTNKSFITISKLCGFNSLSYFSTVFRKIVGQSPSEYRKEIKQ